MAFRRVARLEEGVKGRLKRFKNGLNGASKGRTRFQGGMEVKASKEISKGIA